MPPPVPDSSPSPTLGHDARFPRLVNCVQALSQARTPEAVREIVRRAARDLTGADGATFVLRDGEFCHYVDEDAIAPLWKGQRFPIQICVSGWAMLHRESAVIADIEQDARVPIDAYRRTFVKSLVMVPIRRQQPIGAIGTYWSVPHSSSDDEVALLQALADTTAVALENVQVYAQLEQRVRDRTRQLEYANQELESFAGSVSHDLRAPLAVIMGSTELFRMKYGEMLADDAARLLAHIPAQVARMSALIDDLLRLARVRDADILPVPLDLSALATSLGATSAAVNPDRQVRFVVEPTPPARGDPAFLRIALENLLSNAWKYTARTAAAQVTFGAALQPDGAVGYFVRDNGAGFDPAAAGKLFRPFNRLHGAEYAGTGVGLTIVARIVEKHGGRCWAEGRPGQGATFYFTLGS